MKGARRKITKKELKEDKLVTAYYKTRAFLDLHGKTLTFVAVGVAVVAIIVGLIINSKIQANKTAGYELFQAQNQIDNSDFQSAMEKLKKVIDTYPGTRNASQAVLVMAKTFYQIADYDSALFYARKYTGRDPLLNCTALDLQAASLENKGDYKTAAEIYSKAANLYPKLFTAPVYLIDAGRCFILAGDNEKAIQVLNKVRHDYPESKLVSRANELIVRAGGKFEYAPTKMKLF